MRNFGFSTGAVALSDYRKALLMIACLPLKAVEISALRLFEVAPLLRDLANLDLQAYDYVSFHAPSSFDASEEQALAEALFYGVPDGWPIVMHPDAIYDVSVWRCFGSRLAIENMDRRKPVGRSCPELELFFDYLPEAKFCFDIGHARQCDPSMTEAFLFLERFKDRLVEVHLSEVNTESKHDCLSYGSILAYRQVSNLIPAEIPVILESRVSSDGFTRELRDAAQALPAQSAVQLQS